MPEANGASGTPADPTAQPQAGDNPDANPQAGDADDGSTSISLEAARKLRSENENLRTRLRAAETAEQERARAEMTELQRATDRATQLEKDLEAERTARRETTLRLETVSAARRLGFRDPELAYRLIGDVDYNDKGEPKNLDKMLADLSKSHPYLVNGTSDYGGGPRGTPPSSGPDMNDAIRRAAGR